MLSSESLNISSPKAAAAVLSRHNIYQWRENGGSEFKTSSAVHTQDVPATIGRVVHIQIPAVLVQDTQQFNQQIGEIITKMSILGGNRLTHTAHSAGRSEFATNQQPCSSQSNGISLSDIFSMVEGAGHGIQTSFAEAEGP